MVTTRRADAERNIAAIIAAGTRLLSADPNASVAEIAKAAGVGRVTLYGHFATREALVDAVMDHAIEVTLPLIENPALEEMPAPEAMATLIATSWEILARHSSLFLAASQTMPMERIRRHHERPLLTVERLIARGRDDGDFRTDLPLSWLVSTFFGVLHSAAQEVEAGRLERSSAESVLSKTILPLLSYGA
ncbi:TetR/AcrR family transcriptional regulator [Nonomuraea sp. NPDC050556]|uniref:TetR/AcrR family transcriptional regulator n=1 Tax=Nonomuraea sp. NPDC050556 TaxID=3364369 RepID=UPI0037928869